MTTKTTPQLANPPPDSASPGRWLRVARLVAMLFMAFCSVTFLWGLLLFPRYGLVDLDAIRPNDNWSDATLLAVLADAGLSLAALGNFQLALTSSFR